MAAPSTAPFNISVLDSAGIIQKIKANEPFLLSGTSFDKRLSFEEVSQLILKVFGDDYQVPVVYCSGSSQYDDPEGSPNNKEEGPPTKSLGQVLRYLSEDHSDDDARTMYLKDWHIMRSRDQHSSATLSFTPPWGFNDDWLNGWYERGAASDDYRFL